MGVVDASMTALSIMLTLGHALEETFLSKDAPLWEAFGEIAEVEIPHWLGFPAFFLGLVGALTAIAVVGYSGDPFWLGVLVGARLGDCWFSHWWPTIRGHAVPGNLTTPFYVAEAAVAATMGPSVAGAALGAAAFAAVIPGLRVLGVLLRWTAEH